MLTKTQFITTITRTPSASIEPQQHRPSKISKNSNHLLINSRLPLMKLIETRRYTTRKKMHNCVNKKLQLCKKKDEKLTHFRGAGLQSMPRGSGEVPSCLCFGGLRLCIFFLYFFCTFNSLPLSTIRRSHHSNQNSEHTGIEIEIGIGIGIETAIGIGIQIAMLKLGLELGFRWSDRRRWRMWRGGYGGQRTLRAEAAARLREAASAVRVFYVSVYTCLRQWKTNNSMNVLCSV